MSGWGRVYFTYNKRRRLVREQRQGANAYDLRYEYDDGGNRERKREYNPSGLQVKRTEYIYDLSDPSLERELFKARVDALVAGSAIAYVAIPFPPFWAKVTWAFLTGCGVYQLF